ncbi:hypothetical protein PybrP1_010452 [[Pythium] brassicae (nom. inval.)]|nr:hypothetical protein PybrP1_010452 [[Pythium] brassicae (nom. inval.)]
MEMILAPMDHQTFGKDAMRWPAPTAATEPLRRLPSLFRHAEASTSTTTTSERSPRLVGMSDVLNTTRALGDSPAARLPSIGSMIRREESGARVSNDASAASPAAASSSSTGSSAATTAMSASHADANSMSPVQKQCMDLYKQLREVPSLPLDARSHPEYALGSLLAGAALSQLASIQEKKDAAASAQQQPRVREQMLSEMDTASESDSGDKSKRASSAKLCGMSECRKRAKAGGFCIAHGGGLRCSESGCQKHAVSLGLCISHGGGKRCTIEGCLNASRKNGVCWSHGGKRLCKLDGCNKGPKSGGYCWSHGGKMKK